MKLPPFVDFGYSRVNVVALSALYTIRRLNITVPHKHFNAGRCRTNVSDATHKQALSDFLADVEKRAFRMAQISTGNRDDALDIVQDAMIKLVNNYADKDAEQWPPLFYRILNNRINDHHRRNKTRQRLFGWFSTHPDDKSSDEIENAPSMKPEASEQLKSQRAVQHLDQALTALPQRQQQAVMLRLWEGMDVATTAKSMGCTQGSVKTHYSRAITKLRTSLGDHWP